MQWWVTNSDCSGGNRDTERLSLVLLGGATGGEVLKTGLDKLLVVVDEHVGELVGGLVVGLLIGPGLTGVENLGVDAAEGLGDLKVEVGLSDKLGVEDGAVEDGVDAGTGVLDAHALGAGSGAATAPAGVDKVDVGVVLGDLLLEELTVLGGGESHEGSTEAGTEGGGGLGDAALGTGDLGGVAGKEVVHGLVAGELGDRGENAEGISGQEDDILGVAAHLVLVVVLNVLDGVADTTVLGLAGVKVVGLAVLDGGVLEESTGGLDGTVDLGLVLLSEVDGLGVAAALEVEDTVVIPAVLVITDEGAVGVSREGGLTGTGETEEEGGGAILALVGRAVHGEGALEGKPGVHHGEDTLLHLTTVPGAHDDGNLLLDVEANEDVRVEALVLPLLVGELAGVDDSKGRLEVLGLLLGLRADEHVAGEVSLPGELGDKADRAAGGRAGTAVEVVHVHLVDAAVVVDDLGVELVEDLLAHRLVDGAEVDVLSRGHLLDDPVCLFSFRTQS